MFKVHILLYHSTLDLRVTKKKKRRKKTESLALRQCEDRVLDGPASGEKGSKGRN